MGQNPVGDYYAAHGHTRPPGKRHFKCPYCGKIRTVEGRLTPMCSKDPSGKRHPRMAMQEIDMRLPRRGGRKR